MDNLTELINEIQDCTLEIELHYPELYKRLDQSPYQKLFSSISAEALQDYLSQLKVKLETFKNPSYHEPSAAI